MTAIQFNARLKLDFFDRPGVIAMMDKRERRIMFKVLGDAWQQARKEIKIVAPTNRQLQKLAESADDPARRKRLRRRIRDKQAQVSNPGEPPKAHTRSRKSIRFILFHIDRQRHTGIVGPVKFNAKGRNVPEVLAAGGTARVSRKTNGRRRYRSVRIAPRPIPGLLNAIPRFAAMWKER